MSNPECEQFSGRLKDICNGTALVDGAPINSEHVKHFRALNGIEPGPAWQPGDKPRGIGDVIATVTHYTGIAAAVKAINPNCGCAERQESLNKKLPFGKNP
jgi:hypothetical protein